MTHFLPYSLAALIAVAVLCIGSTYILFPHKIVQSFGLRAPALDPDTQSWLRLKGVRDVGLGLLVLTLMVITDSRSLGIVLLVAAVVPFGDLYVILTSNGSKSKAWSIHGVTCAAMLAVGFVLLHTR